MHLACLVCNPSPNQYPNLDPDQVLGAHFDEKLVGAIQAIRVRVRVIIRVRVRVRVIIRVNELVGAIQATLNLLTTYTLAVVTALTLVTHGSNLTYGHGPQ